MIRRIAVAQLAAGLMLLWLLGACGGTEAGGDGAEAAERPPLPEPTGSGLAFVEVTRAAGIDFVHSLGDGDLSNLVESSAGGLAFLDYDGDGYLDLYVTSGAYTDSLSQGEPPEEAPRNRLYRNLGNGRFEDATEEAGVGDRGYGMGATVGDYDNDGHPDLYVTNYGPNSLYHNEGDGTFREVSSSAGVAGDGCSVGAVWVDYDNDGLLDLYVGNYIEFDPEYELYYAPDGFPGPLAYPGQADVLYRNLGDGTFEDVTVEAGVRRPNGRAMGVGAADYDGDGYVDIYVANDAMENYLFRNLNGQAFAEVARRVGVAYNHRGDATSSMAVDFADYDSDGRLDLFVSDMSYGALYRNDGPSSFTDVTRPSGVASVSGQFTAWSAGFIDYDNDGDRDLFQTNGEADHLQGEEDLLLENTGGGEFRDASDEHGRYFERESVGRGGAFADYDNDGDMDVFVVNLGARPVLLRNDGGDRNGWLHVDLVGRRSNRDGVGARLTLEAGDLRQVAQKMSATGYLSQGDPRVHFGLGEHDFVDRLEIRWPSGTVQVLEDVRANQTLQVVEPEE